MSTLTFTSIVFGDSSDKPSTSIFLISAPSACLLFGELRYVSRSFPSVRKTNHESKQRQSVTYQNKRKKRLVYAIFFWLTLSLNYKVEQLQFQPISVLFSLKPCSFINRSHSKTMLLARIDQRLRAIHHVRGFTPTERFQIFCDSTRCLHDGSIDFIDKNCLRISRQSCLILLLLF